LGYPSFSVAATCGIITRAGIPYLGVIARVTVMPTVMRAMNLPASAGLSFSKEYYNVDILTGKLILEAAVSLDEGLGKIDLIISKMSGDEKSLWISNLGNVFRVINEEIFMKIEAEFPNLQAREWTTPLE
jgi:hypothetical protein